MLGWPTKQISLFRAGSLDAHPVPKRHVLPQQLRSLLERFGHATGLFATGRGEVGLATAPNLDQRTKEVNRSPTPACALRRVVVLQAPRLNQITWVALEEYTREPMTQGHELYIHAGGYGSGGVGSTLNTMPTIAGGDITVPSRYWKVVVVLPVGADDVQHVSTATRVIAVDMPNTQSVDALDWHEYRTSVDAIEDSTGLDLMSLVPAGIQATLEAQVDNGPTQ